MQMKNACFLTLQILLESLFWVISVSPENTAVLQSALDNPQPEEASTPQTGKCIIPELWVGERVCESSLLSALV